MPISSGLNSDLIRVGIILPEDGIKELTLHWAESLDVESSASIPQNSCTLNLSADTDSFSVSQTDQVLTELIITASDQVDSLSSRSGIKVDPVIAGRGFHWEKQIPVYLPGQLTITIEKGNFKLINTLDVEAYVACVATSEMGAEAPDDLLAAQTVVARCWSLALAEAKHLDAGFDVCNDDCCQRYQGTTYLTEHSLKAALDTRGEVLTYENAVIDARYSKNCGGMAEDYDTVWEGGTVPYLTHFWDGPEPLEGLAVDDFQRLWNYMDAYCSSKRFESVDLAGMLGKVDVSGSYYRWEQVVEKQLLLANLKKYHDLSWTKITGLQVGERGASARAKYVYLQGLDTHGHAVEQKLVSEYGIRQMLSESFLYSSAFIVMNSKTLESDDHIALKGVGWGHGVGLCQMGALGMALEGINYRDILSHYYPGTTLENL
ncbi:MAG: SpoIID/LytB domain-containing protein [Candidatus Marinimicrobia bacterium]|nr:SpoIID/LytB domain-containing protein [Candidatus Neomarinimicrobiota bacterium]MCF7850066.1 SpoIID/LytB domain-containing protein [Candidatus Neomarinimicrobiota bacterium]MCF7904726.1 SpoIID/LytB domain-containing protein [Candidatus Neomarinimicrobiota bacterium]